MIPTSPMRLPGAEAPSSPRKHSSESHVAGRGGTPCHADYVRFVIIARTNKNRPAAPPPAGSIRDDGYDYGGGGTVYVAVYSIPFNVTVMTVDPSPTMFRSR